MTSGSGCSSWRSDAAKKYEVASVKESLSADAGEESSKVLIDWGGVHGVDVKAVQLFDEIKHHRERGCVEM